MFNFDRRFLLCFLLEWLSAPDYITTTNKRKQIKFKTLLLLCRSRKHKNRTSKKFYNVQHCAHKQFFIHFSSHRSRVGKSEYFSRLVPVIGNICGDRMIRRWTTFFCTQTSSSFCIFCGFYFHHLFVYSQLCADLLWYSRLIQKFK